jgi:hypothetical protein
VPTRFQKSDCSSGWLMHFATNRMTYADVVERSDHGSASAVRWSSDCLTSTENGAHPAVVTSSKS